jgi:hypothetical protein
MTRTARRHPLLSPNAYASRRGGIGYVRQMRSEEAEILYPQAPSLVPGLTVFVLHAADGTPLAITDSFAEAAPRAIGWTR